MSKVLALLAASAVGAVYRSHSAGLVPMSGVDSIGLALSSALAALVAAAIGDAIDARKPDRPDNKALWTLLIFRNILFSGSTGWLVVAVSVHVGGPYWISNHLLATQFAAVTLLAGAVAYGELVSRYRDTPGRLLATDPTVVYLCVNIAAAATALALVKEFEAITAEKHKLIYETLLAGFGAIAFFRTSLFTVRVSGNDIGVGPSTLLKALLDSSDTMLNRWQALNRGAMVREIMGSVDFDKPKTALPTTCFTLMTEFPPAVQAGVGEDIEKLVADDTTPKEAKAIMPWHLHDPAGRRRSAGKGCQDTGYDHRKFTSPVRFRSLIHIEATTSGLTLLSGYHQ
jgi:hypothetical protein